MRFIVRAKIPTDSAIIAEDTTTEPKFRRKLVTLFDVLIKFANANLLSSYQIYF